MRSADAQLHWARLIDRRVKRPFFLEAFGCSGVPGLDTIAIVPASPLTVVCGANGVGKSRIIEALCAALDAPQLSPTQITRLAGADTYARVSDGDGTRTFNVSLVDEAHLQTNLSEPVVALFDAATDTHRVREFFRSQPNLHDLTEAVGKRSLDDIERKRVEYIVGRNYEAIEVSEITDVDVTLSGVDAVPFFTVTSSGVQYDANHMGLGEFGLHLLAWYVTRLPAKSVLMLEEPESFTAPASQSRVIDLLVEQIDERKLTVVLTTHSPEIVEKCPRSCVVLAVRQGASTFVEQRPTDSQLANAVGLRRPLVAVVLVEDRVAADTLRVLLNRFTPGLTNSLLIQAAGGRDISTMLFHTVEHVSVPKYLGIYDGDQRRRRGEQAAVTFLPTDEAPEVFLRRAADQNVSALARLVGVPENDMRMILGNLEGVDHHDWLEELRKAIDKPGVAVVDILLEIWLSHDENRKQAEAFVGRIVEMIWPAEGG